MPRANDDRYKVVTKLPKQALKVSEYARQQGFADHSLVYHKLRRNTANYKIVVFQGINFVIP